MGRMVSKIPSGKFKENPENHIYKSEDEIHAYAIHCRMYYRDIPSFIYVSSELYKGLKKLAKKQELKFEPDRQLKLPKYPTTLLYRTVAGEITIRSPKYMETPLWRLLNE